MEMTLNKEERRVLEEAVLQKSEAIYNDLQKSESNDASGYREMRRYIYVLNTLYEKLING